MIQENVQNGREEIEIKAGFPAEIKCCQYCMGNDFKRCKSVGFRVERGSVEGKTCDPNKHAKNINDCQFRDAELEEQGDK